MIKVMNARKYDGRVVAQLTNLGKKDADGNYVVDVKGVGVVDKEDGTKEAWAPKRIGSDGTAHSVLRFDQEAANAAITEMLEKGEIKLADKEYDVPGGKKIATITLACKNVSLWVTVFVGEDGKRSLALPGRPYTDKDGNKKQSLFVWPFDGVEDVAAARQELIDEIIAAADAAEAAEQ